MMRISKYIYKIFLITLIYTYLFINSALATVYFVDQGAIGNDNNSGVSINQPWKTIAKANKTLKAGDSVYIRQGTYAEPIEPEYSGSANNEIKYSNYNDEIVTISNISSGINLSNRNYINVTGIKVTNVAIGLWINGGNYNTVSYCTFSNHTGNNWTANGIYNGASYNWIHHCTFDTNGECTDSGSDEGGVIRLGLESEKVHTNYNLIEDSTFFHGGHHVFELAGVNNVVRNNYIYNDAWTKGKGNRTLYMSGQEGYTGYNLIEGNRFGYAAAPCDAPTVGNVAISTPYNIFRYNYMYHHNAYGLGFGYYAAGSSGSNNYVYNNGIHNSGYNIDPSYENSLHNSAVWFVYSQTKGNILKNNLYSLNNRIYAGYIDNQSFANEYIDTVKGDPLFSNATATPPINKSNSSLPDFTFSSSLSPAIDSGGFLTRVNSSDNSSGISLIVNDARYFQDGRWARKGLIQADWIAVGTVENVVQIASIDYTTNTITLLYSINRSDNDPVWLYKKSDGRRVLFGSAPDAGATEFQPIGTAPSPPANFHILLLDD